MGYYYLRKYVGTYRVKAELDTYTNDIPRNHLGEIDDSFDDFYIDCQNGIKIKHGTGSVLGCFIPSKNKGVNMLRKMYEDNIGSKFPKEEKTTLKRGNTCYFENLCQELVDKWILIEAEVTDGDVLFTFNDKDLDKIKKYVKIKTSGKSISPLSSANLPKSKDILPKDELARYKDIVSQISDTPIIQANTVKQINSSFKKKLPKKWDLERKQLLLDFRGYLYHKNLWEKYIKFLEKSIKK